MRRYRSAIFKYAILINVALAFFVTLLSLKGISDYFGMLERWTARVPADEINGMFQFDGPVEPGPGQLLFPSAMVLAGLVLILSTIASLKGGGGWSYWLRILSFLAILCVIWVETLKLLVFYINEGMGNLILQNRSLPIALAASLWLAYNISYRPAAPDAGAPSR